MTKKNLFGILIFTLLLTLLVSCGGGGGGSSSATGQGGPGLSGDTTSTSEGTTIATNDDASSLAGGAEGDDSLTSHINTEGSGDEGGDEEGSGDEGDEGSGGDDTDSLLGTGGGTTGDSGSGEGTTSGGSGTVADASSVIDPGSDADFTIDITGGNWFVEETGTLFSSSTADEVKEKIKELHDKMIGVIKKFREGSITRDEARDLIADIKEEIKTIRKNYGNGDNEKGGISTDLQDQNMVLSLNSTESGWYRLSVSAKNSGTLPPDYDTFTLAVVDQDSGEELGTIKVPASENRYNTGLIEFQLDNPSGKKLAVLWKNDAYLENSYNTVLNIKGISLQKINEETRSSKPTGRLSGNDYSMVDGRWFTDKGNVYTHWQDQIIGYTFKNLEGGTYEVTIQASNYGKLPLPKNYRTFDVDLDSEYDSVSMNISAKNNGWSKETVKMIFPEGDTTLFITWINDQIEEGKYDTNLMIKSVSIKKVKSSSLTAFLIKTKPGNKVFILSVLIALSAIFLVIYIMNRRKYS